MPPNIKYARNLPFGDELIAVAQTGSQSAPAPLTLDHSDDDDAFFLRDIEENVGNEESGKFPPTLGFTPHEHEADHEHAIADTREHEHEHHRARRVLKHLASQVMDQEELDIDAKRLAKTVRDAGEFAYGVIACEVWMLDEEKLVRPKGGWWHNNKICSSGGALKDLASIEPAPIMPGVDLPGILWSESHRDGLGHHLRHSSFFHRQGNRSTDNLHTLQHHGHGNQHHHASSRNSSRKPTPVTSVEDLSAYFHIHTTTANPHALLWRDLHSIAEDPDSAKSARLGQLIDAGLCAAAGIPFHVNTHRGLVIYYARSHTRTHLLSNVANDAFLRSSAHLIGHAAALSEMRRASVEARRRQNKQAIERLKRNMLEFHRNKDPHKARHLGLSRVHPRNDPSEEPQDQMSQDGSIDLEGLPPEESQWDKTLHFMRTWCHKCQGGNLQVPPALTFRQTLWMILGAFCGLLVLSSLNEYYKILSEDDYFLLIGPFGALMTLQYGLTAAPASQPRNAILGQAVSGAVSLAFTYIPESILATWLRRALGPAFAIGAMVKLGVTHPPAGAHAVLYASGQYNFGFYALVVLSSAISVIPATVVNNLSSKRQYPTYWTMIKLPAFFDGEANDAEK